MHRVGGQIVRGVSKAQQKRSLSVAAPAPPKKVKKLEFSAEKLKKNGFGKKITN